MNICGFFGKYRWLSNFWLCTIVVRWKGEVLRFTCVEEGFQSCKSDSLETRKRFQGVGPLRAKRMGKEIRLREDWSDVKLQVMEFFVRQKFLQNPDLRRKLINTGSAYLEETNQWGDTFWGVSRGVGQNHLGKILMKIRKEMVDE